MLPTVVAKYRFYAFIKDIAGRTSAASAFDITYDGIPPRIVSVTLNPE